MKDFEIRPLTKEIIDRFANKPYWICMHCEDDMGTTGTYFSTWYIKITSELSAYDTFTWIGIPADYVEYEPDDMWSTPSWGFAEDSSDLAEWEVIWPLEFYSEDEITELVELADDMYNDYLNEMDI